jgi:hypothetical protein
MTGQTCGRLVATLIAALLAATSLASAGSAMTRTESTTVVTFVAPDCNGCTLSLIHATWDDEFWESGTKTVRDGEVTFRVPTELTHGMSVAIRAPWEGATGYVTLVAFKYAGQETGDRVTFSEARHARKASACWAGTTTRSATIRLATRRAVVSGYDGPRTPAALVYATVTQDAMVPLQRTFHGILGSQDVNICGRR